MRLEKELLILFADVVGSTKLYDVLGDVRARETVARCIGVMTTATEQFGGTLIKTMGDEIMATFEDADAAMDAAAQMQDQITEELAINGTSVSVRIGAHQGPVILEKGDVFGNAVNTASRMTSQAKSGQIITTAETVSKLSPRWQASIRQIDIATVRGQSDEIALYEVIWKREDITSMVPSIGWNRPQAAKKLRLRLHYAGQEVEVHEGRPIIGMGRSEDNDLVVIDNLISRLHARIELKRGKFRLVDQSTNGTCVVTGKGQELFVRRDNLPIEGEGYIGLGQVVNKDSPKAIRFETVTD